MENALAKAKDEKGLKRVSRFLSEGHAPTAWARGFRDRPASHGFLGIDLAQATAMTL